MIAALVACAAPAAAEPPRDVYLPRLFVDVGAFVATDFGRTASDSGTTYWNDGAGLVRMTLGVQIARIVAGGAPSFHLRVGVSGYVSELKAGSGKEAGLGFDSTFDLPVTCYARLGGHIGAATASYNTALLTAGPRIFLFEATWLGLDLFHFTKPPDAFAPIATGVLGGGGFTF